MGNFASIKIQKRGNNWNNLTMLLESGLFNKSNGTFNVQHYSVSKRYLISDPFSNSCFSNRIFIGFHCSFHAAKSQRKCKFQRIDSNVDSIWRENLIAFQHKLFRNKFQKALQMLAPILKYLNILFFCQ